MYSTLHSVKPETLSLLRSISIVKSSTQNTTLNSINPRKIDVIYVRLVNLAIVNPKSWMHIWRAKEKLMKKEWRTEIMSYLASFVSICKKSSNCHKQMCQTFYKRKLDVYHVTGHCSLTSQRYGVLWPETLAGCMGNDIASSVVLLLNKLLADNIGLEHITLWSDSCIPQNRNKVLSTALMLLIKS